jgi:hypothetical protein
MYVNDVYALAQKLNQPTTLRSAATSEPLDDDAATATSRHVTHALAKENPDDSVGCAYAHEVTKEASASSMPLAVNAQRG